MYWITFTCKFNRIWLTFKRKSTDARRATIRSHIAATSVGQSLGNGIVQGLSRPTPQRLPEEAYLQANTGGAFLENPYADNDGFSLLPLGDNGAPFDMNDPFELNGLFGQLDPASVEYAYAASESLRMGIHQSYGLGAIDFTAPVSKGFFARQLDVIQSYQSSLSDNPYSTIFSRARERVLYNVIEGVASLGALATDADYRQQVYNGLSYTIDNLDTVIPQAFDAFTSQSGWKQAEDLLVFGSEVFAGGSLATKALGWNAGEVAGKAGSSINPALLGRLESYKAWKLENNFIPETVDDFKLFDNPTRVNSGFKTFAWSKEWPPFDGFLNGERNLFTLLPGTQIDRFGFDGGSFLAPVGDSYGARAVKPGSLSKPYNVFEVLKPLEVEVGVVRPWFGESGLGTQYKLMNNSRVNDLLNEYLKPVYRGSWGQR